MNDLDFIPLSEPYKTELALANIKECLDSGWVSSAGTLINKFEAELAKLLNIKHVVCVTSGTAALHLALLSLNINHEHEVIVPTQTFAASLNPVIYCNATPILIDVAYDSYSIDLELLRDFLEKQCVERNKKLINRSSNKEVKAVIAVHLYGSVCEMQELQKICAQYNLLLIEDAAEALAACYDSQAAGSFGDVGILSFNGNKIITTGQGGAVLTNDEKIAERARHLSTQAKSDGLRYKHDQVGYNYRLANINAALGLSQLELLDQILEKKRQINSFYKSSLSDLAIRFQSSAAKVKETHWINTITISPNKVTSWEDLKESFDKNKIQFRPLWYPLHLLEPYRNYQRLAGESAEKLYRYGLCLPSSPGLNEQQLTRVVECLRKELA